MSIFSCSSISKMGRKSLHYSVTNLLGFCPWYQGLTVEKFFSIKEPTGNSCQTFDHQMVTCSWFLLFWNVFFFLWCWTVVFSSHIQPQHFYFIMFIYKLNAIRFWSSGTMKIPRHDNQCKHFLHLRHFLKLFLHWCEVSLKHWLYSWHTVTRHTLLETINFSCFTWMQFFKEWLKSCCFLFYYIYLLA